ncbi:hydroxyacylglutathione hydrolase [Methylocystis bryophila]|uniref:Hydroxyacylglutathione hydrolase n=1 Tax=Methylocystis bryophila TaxID=655015 RepID=A0A1W6MYB1_9HYPH|nr:hydroxyacylglutathione hydrolase [Methylocystis bryophila]ARN82574.1 hydroxyacylglutathione hydrolase [Methylocystis bryophila]BDV38784.1 hydroxyacylglutathione hydrolase [Methylocystis bryophila]
MGISVHQFICLTDNFGLLARDEETGAVASIDAPDGEAIAREAGRIGWPLTDVWLTHHHLDHIEGVPALRQAFSGLRVVGARRDEHRLGRLDLLVEDGDHVMLGNSSARVIDVCGHTRGHIAYYFAEDEIVFVGDTLFSLGCGKVFEGSMAEMYDSLQKLADLPDETRVYCGHEYTQTNARFALTVDPENPLLAQRAKEVDRLRTQGCATLPTTIGLERATNPFLRADDPLVRRAIGMSEGEPVQVFTKIREMKSAFRG